MKRIDFTLSEKVRVSRAQGESIPEISLKYSVPRSSVWRLTRDVQLNAKQKQILQSRMGGSTIRLKERKLLADKQANRMIRTAYSRKCRPLILAALYWAEGTKSSFVFTNTDADMIRIFLHILRTSFQVSNSRLKVMVRIGSEQNKRAAVTHWANVTELLPEKLSLNIHSKFNKTTTQHGLCRITVSKGGQLLKTVMALNKELYRHVLKS